MPWREKEAGRSYIQLRNTDSYELAIAPDLIEGGTTYLRGLLRPLAHLGLARAYEVTGDKGKSLAEYRGFLTLWKNTDPDLSYSPRGHGCVRETVVPRYEELAQLLSGCPATELHAPRDAKREV